MKGTCLEIDIRDAISRLQFAPRSNNLLISSWDSTLRLYDVDNGLLRLDASMEVGLLGCCFQDETVAVSIGSDCCVRRHDLHSNIHTLLGNHDDLVTCVEYSEESCQTITGGLDRKIISWDMRMENSIGFSKVIDGELESMSLHGFHLILACGTSINMYDLRCLKEPLHTKESCVDYRIRCIRLFPNCQGYAVGSIDGRVAVEFLSQYDTNELSYTFRCHPKSKDGMYYLASVNDIVFHPSCHSAFVTGDNEGYVIKWDSHCRKRLFELPKYQGCVASLSYNHGEQLLAVASSQTFQEANEIEAPQICIYNE
ncbi:hypothetical protein Sjap_023698 [Stephania japonica]|uniref:Mitotic checkpoint protein BUB3.3 n=1 Tax=Stephania japonica TaxID=461633 RepID=A0AAP0EC25_9MAGN